MNDAEQSFREFEYTGDLGIELKASTRSELFRRAVLALFAIIVEKQNIVPAARRDLTIEADNDADLMHDLLTALVGLFTVENFIWCDAAVTEAGNALRVVVRGEASIRTATVCAPRSRPLLIINCRLPNWPTVGMPG